MTISCRNPCRKAFTLIELLAVAAIISVLAALLMPALRSALDASRKAQCMNKQQKKYLASTAYA